MIVCSRAWGSPRAVWEELPVGRLVTSLTMSTKSALVPGALREQSGDLLRYVAVVIPRL